MFVNIVIVGRSNVGKSTLFNRMLGKKSSIVSNIPGVTRDRNIQRINFSNIDFQLIDTAGLEYNIKSQLSHKAQEQSWIGIKESDIILFVFDEKVGILHNDLIISNLLRKENKPIIILANKSEIKTNIYSEYEYLKIGLGSPLFISAEHNLGISLLWHKIISLAKKKYINNNNYLSKISYKSDKKYINIALIGRPNTGKSTLINTIIGEYRMITGIESGITRDSVFVETLWNNEKIRIYDTAGLRKKNNIKDKIEKLSSFHTIKSIYATEITILVIDSTLPCEKQDVKIADLVTRIGHGLVIALNKWDLVINKSNTLKNFYNFYKISLPQLYGIKIIPISSISQYGFNMLIKNIKNIYEKWNKKISTGILNRWLKQAIIYHKPSIFLGRQIKIKYITQIDTRPPSFILFCSNPKVIKESYIKYLIKDLRKNFDIFGIPIYFNIKKSINPFIDKKN